MVRLIKNDELACLLKPGWRLLDAGAGDQPFFAATTLLDRTPRTFPRQSGDFRENPTLSLVSNGVPYVVGDIESLPFVSKAFDFVYASHVIEHVEDPTRALSELSRVGRRGYIECPRPWFEFVDGSPFHRWFVDFDDAQLVFRPKSDAETTFGLSRRLFDHNPELFSRYYGDVFNARVGQQVSPMFGQFKSMCHLCVYWEGSIEHRYLASNSY